jgi:outer membrane biosynthesis protein TonB
MSQQTATARAAQRGGSPTRRPARSLQVISAAPPRRGQSAFVALCTLLLFGGLIAVLLLNTEMAKGSFELDRLQARTNALADTQESLAHDVDAQSAPAELARRALALGMVPSSSAAFLRLSDGRILGHATPATRQGTFSVATGTPGPTATTPKPTTTKPTPRPATTKPVTKPTTKPTRTTAPNAPAKKTTTTPGQGG